MQVLATVRTSAAKYAKRFTYAVAMAGVLAMSPALQAASGDFTDWGWPQPYEKVSPKSISG